MRLPAHGSRYFGKPQSLGAENSGETVHEGARMLYYRRHSG